MSLWLALAILPASRGAFSAETPDLAASAAPEFLTIPKTPWPGFSDLVIEPGGTVWIMANNKVFYWTGNEFREPVSGPLQSGYYLAGLYGGPDRGAYATQRGEREHEGQIYKLSDGAANRVTSFYYEVGHECPGLYVSRSGMIFNWGYRFLARFASNAWERAEARLALRETAVFDLGQHVYFYYDNRLYRAGADGFLNLEPPRWHGAEPGRKRIVGVVWNRQNALLVDYGEKAGIFAFDLASCREVPLDAARAALRATAVYDAFALPDGSVWLLGFTEGEKAYTFFKLATDGTPNPILSTRDVPWDNTRCWQYPESVRVTSGGAIVFGLPEDGIAIWQDGKVRRYGWRQGFAAEVRQILEDPKGNLWAPVGEGVARFRIEPASAPAVNAFKDWEEYLLVPRSRLWEVEPGRLALFRTDKPGTLSRWDGTNWTFQAVPFDPAQIGRSMVDDRGHLIVEMAADSDGTFDVGPDRVERFDGMAALLAAAAKRGAKEFRQCEGFQGAVVEPSNRIWFGYHNYRSVYRIEGERTNPFSFPADVYYLYPSAIHGALFRTQGGRFYRYDRGQMAEVPPSLGDAKALLLGDNGFQPYERALTREAPWRLYPVLNGSQRRLFFDADGFEAAVEGNGPDAPSVVLPPYVERLRPSARGGAWLECAEGGGDPVRLLAQRRFDLDFSGTPLFGRMVRRAREDAAGNLWFETHPTAGSEHVFVRRLSGVRVVPGPVPSRCGRRLAFAVAVSPAHHAPQVQGLVRLAPSDWIPAGTNGADFAIRFPTSGVYTVEVSGLLMGARLPSAAPFTIAADVALPDTVRTDAPVAEVSVQDPFWIPPVRADKTVENARLVLTWRVDDRPWRRIPPDTPLDLVALKPGRHTLQFAAEEDEFWIDPTPVSISIRYAPDYEAAVERRLESLVDPDGGVRERTARQLLELGPEAVPAIRRRLEAANAESRLARALRAVLLRLEMGGERKLDRR